MALVRDILRATQTQLQTMVSITSAIEDVIRDAVFRGVTRDAIAVECSLSIEAVDRVLDGGTVFDWPPR